MPHKSAPPGIPEQPQLRAVRALYSGRRRRLHGELLSCGREPQCLLYIGETYSQSERPNLARFSVRLRGQSR